MGWLIHWPPRVFKVYLESLATGGGEAIRQQLEPPKPHRSRAAAIQKMENCSSLRTQPYFHCRLSPVNTLLFCPGIEIAVVALRVHYIE